MIFKILLYVHFIFLIFHIECKEEKIQKWTPELLYKYMNTHGKKNLPNIIDPDTLLDSKMLNNTKKVLNEIYTKHKVITHLIIVNYINDEYNGEEIGIYNFTKKYIDYIKFNQDYIICLFAIQNRTMTMIVSKTLEKKFSAEDRYQILRKTNEYLLFEDYTNGMEVLSNEIIFFIEHQNFFRRYWRNIIPPILTLIIFIIIFIIIPYYSGKNRIQRLTMSDEEKLNKIRDFLKKCKVRKEIISETCIICLEPLNDNIEDEDFKTNCLPCGHKYHFKCISEWMLKHKNCPMCRERIDIDLPSENGDEELQNDIIRIQTELHPAFAILAFDIINDELTWAIAGNAPLFGALAQGALDFI